MFDLLWFHFDQVFGFYIISPFRLSEKLAVSLLHALLAIKWVINGLK